MQPHKGILKQPSNFSNSPSLRPTATSKSVSWGNQHVFSEENPCTVSKIPDITQKEREQLDRIAEIEYFGASSDLSRLENSRKRSIAKEGFPDDFTDSLGSKDESSRKSSPKESAKQASSEDEPMMEELPRRKRGGSQSFSEESFDMQKAPSLGSSRKRIQLSCNLWSDKSSS